MMPSARRFAFLAMTYVAGASAAVCAGPPPALPVVHVGVTSSVGSSYLVDPLQVIDWHLFTSVEQDVPNLGLAGIVCDLLQYGDGPIYLPPGTASAGMSMFDLPAGICNPTPPGLMMPSGFGGTP